MDGSKNQLFFSSEMEADYAAAESGPAADFSQRRSAVPIGAEEIDSSIDKFCARFLCAFELFAAWMVLSGSSLPLSR
ncbi:hypothetical protein BAB75_15735 [Mycobacteroides immunogenum]|nr:hypothetical protein BAB75_15735 [Mycobacteroides immunogenum]ORV78593.1 hypothetical protein AWC10_12580 [Mycobacteroides immunogenum]